MNIDFTGKILLIGCGGVGRMMAIEAALAGLTFTLRYWRAICLWLSR